jgi:hypothetical protein
MQHKFQLCCVLSYDMKVMQTYMCRSVTSRSNLEELSILFDMFDGRAYPFPVLSVAAACFVNWKVSYVAAHCLKCSNCFTKHCCRLLFI